MIDQGKDYLTHGFARAAYTSKFDSTLSNVLLHLHIGQIVYIMDHPFEYKDDVGAALYVPALKVIFNPEKNNKPEVWASGLVHIDQLIFDFTDDVKELIRRRVTLAVMAIPIAPDTAPDAAASSSAIDRPRPSYVSSLALEPAPPKIMPKRIKNKVLKKQDGA